MLPLTCDADKSPALSLQIFRSVFIVWAAQEYEQAAWKAASQAADAIEYARKNGGITNDPSVVDATAYTISEIVKAYGRSRGFTNGRTSPFEFALDGADYAFERATARAEGETFWNSVLVDANWIEGRTPTKHDRPSSGLIKERLWLENVRGGKKFRVNFPDWARIPWNSFKGAPEIRRSGFDIWIRWYESVLVGRRKGILDQKLKRKAEREIVVRLAAMPDEFWRDGAAVVNAQIQDWIDEANNDGQPSSPHIPETRPAAIEPLWQDGKLTLPIVSPASDLDESSLLASLNALREDLTELAADAIAVPNIDHRPADSRCTQRWPTRCVNT